MEKLEITWINITIMLLIYIKINIDRKENIELLQINQSHIQLQVNFNNYAGRNWNFDTEVDQPN